MKIQEIRKFDVESMSKDEITWKTLVFENQRLLKINKEMQNDIKSISAKEKKLVDLIIALKQHGYPVEQVYEKQNSKSKRSYSPQSYADDTDNEALVSSRVKTVAKPAIVPKLNLGGVRPEPSSDNSFSSENA